MNFLYSDEPIIACSTSQQGNAAIAVLRISGLKSPLEFQSFFTLNLEKLKPRHVYYTTLQFGEMRLDDVCLTYFEAPRSYNGENILEISIHGNLLNTERILNLFILEGKCRAAAPGEFTYRALKNKKLSLSQVEGLDLFLNANTGFALDQGLSLLSGNLHEIYQELWELFLKHKASLELSIDFSEDVGEEAAREHFDHTLSEFAQKFETLVRRVAPMDFNILQPEIVIAGLPNAGKSSFFNFLLADERAIVSNIAGTTRDYLAESLLIENVRYKIIDTAGIREATDVIETEGIKRARKKVEQSFFSILLVNPLETSDELNDLLTLKFDVIFFTHADQAGFAEAREKIVKKYPQLGSIGAISLVSAGRSWEEKLFSRVNKKYLDAVSGQPILLERHKLLILQCKQNLSRYQSLAQCESDVGVLSSELNSMGHCISELIGIISPEQILNSIFSNFCIGK